MNVSELKIGDEFYVGRYYYPVITITSVVEDIIQEDNDKWIICYYYGVNTITHCQLLVNSNCEGIYSSTKLFKK